MITGHLGIGFHPLDLAFKLAELAGKVCTVAAIQRLGNLLLLLGASCSLDEDLLFVLDFLELVGDLDELGTLACKDGSQIGKLLFNALYLLCGMLFLQEGFAGQVLTTIGDGQLCTVFQRRTDFSNSAFSLSRLACSALRAAMGERALVWVSSSSVIIRLIIFAGSSSLSKALLTCELKISAILLNICIIVSFRHRVAVVVSLLRRYICRWRANFSKHVLFPGFLFRTAQELGRFLPCCVVK